MTTDIFQKINARWSAAIDSQIWLRPLVIFAVLAVTAIAPLYISTNRFMLLVGGLIAVGGVFVLLVMPPLGLLLLVVITMIVPSPYLPGGLNVAVLFLGLLMGLWVLDMLVRQRRLWLFASRTMRPLLALIVVTIISFIIGQLSWYQNASHAPLDAQVGGLAIFVLSAGLFLLAAHQINDIRWLKAITWTFIALGAAFIAGWLVPGVGPITSRLFQLGATSNSMFWSWLIALAFSQMLFNRSLGLLGRLVLGVVVLATLYVAFVVNFDWKSGYLPALVAVGVILVLRSWHFVVLAILSGPIAVLYLFNDAVATDEYSYSTRLDAWIIIWNMVKSNPLFGYGPANYYWYTPLFPIRGWAVQFNSHNQYIDIIAQIGLVGLACFFWFAAEVGWLGWKLRSQVRNQDGFTQAYVVGAIAGLAATVASGMLADWFLPFVYNIGYNGFRGGMLAWLFLGGLVSIERLVRRQEQSDQELSVQEQSDRKLAAASEPYTLREAIYD